MRIAQARLTLGDPHDCTDGSDELTVLHALYDTLVRRVGQDYVPHLADTWESDAEGRVWTFRLRGGVRFHDGSPCNARAVADCLARMARDDKGYTLGSPAVWKQYLGGAEIAVVGERDLTITLAAPMADLLDVLEQAFIVAPSAFPRLDAGDTTAQIGSGPYRLTEMSADRIAARRIDDHFAGQPADATVEWICVPDQSERLSLLQDGAVEMANHLDFEASRVLGIRRHEYLAPVAIIYLMNAARGPLADKRLRLALSLAVDREAIVADVMGDAARPLHGFVSPGHYGAGRETGASFDREKARHLLADAGHGDGLALTIDCPTRLPDEAERLTAALGHQLARVGVTLGVRIHQDREEYAHRVRRKEIGDLCVFDSSPMSTYRVLYEKIDSRVAGAWWQGYRNPQVEALIDEGCRTADRSSRAALWKQAYGALQDDPAWLTLYNPVRVIGLSDHQGDFRMPVDGVIDAARLPEFERDS